MTRRVALQIILVVAAMFSASAVPASAQSGEGPSTIEFLFEPATPGASSGLTIRVDYQSVEGPDAKPPALDLLRLTAPIGTVFDTSALTVCTADDDTLQLLGRLACPSDSQIGSGTLEAITGLGPPLDPYRAAVTMFNGPDGLINVVHEPTTGVVFFIGRWIIDGSTLTARPAKFPGGPPDLQTVPSFVDLTFPNTGFVIAPACPDSGEWITAAEIGYADGTSQTASSRQTCGNSGGQTGSPADIVASEPAQTEARPETSVEQPVAARSLPITGGTDLVDAAIVLTAVGLVSRLTRSSLVHPKPE